MHELEDDPGHFHDREEPLQRDFAAVTAPT